MQANHNPAVLVSVLNWNAAENTIRTVRSVLSSTYQNFKVIVLDNNSKDDSASRILAAIPEIELLRLNCNQGYAAAHKKSVAKAITDDFELIWILNNDVIVSEKALANMVVAYLRNPKGIYGGLGLADDNSTILFAGGIELSKSGIFDMKQPYNKFRGRPIKDFTLKDLTRQVGNVEGSNMLIPVNIIKKYGFIKTSFFLYGEETDYSIRLWLKHKIGSYLVANAWVCHAESSSFNLSDELKYVKLYYLTRNTEFVYRKYFKQPTPDQAASFMHLLKFFLKHIFRVAPHKDEQYRANYYRRLAYLHVIFGIKGKFLAPEKFLEMGKRWPTNNA